MKSRTKNNVLKLRCRQIQLDCTKFYFTNDVVREWNKLPPSMVQGNTMNSFKNKLTTISSNEISDRAMGPGLLLAVWLHLLPTAFNFLLRFFTAWERERERERGREREREPSILELPTTEIPSTQWKQIITFWHVSSTVLQSHGSRREPLMSSPARERVQIVLWVRCRLLCENKSREYSWFIWVP